MVQNYAPKPQPQTEERAEPNPCVPWDFVFDQHSLNEILVHPEQTASFQ